MARDVTLTALVEYTAWEREKWQEWLRHQGEAVMELSAGPHGDGRFARVGELVQHIFGAEKRYVERLSGRPLGGPGRVIRRARSPHPVDPAQVRRSPYRDACREICSDWKSSWILLREASAGGTSGSRSSVGVP